MSKGGHGCPPGLGFRVDEIPSQGWLSISLHLNDHENPTYQFQTVPVNSHICRETDVLYFVNSISELELL